MGVVRVSPQTSTHLNLHVRWSGSSNGAHNYFEHRKLTKVRLKGGKGAHDGANKCERGVCVTWSPIRPNQGTMNMVLKIKLTCESTFVDRFCRRCLQASREALWRPYCVDFVHRVHYNFSTVSCTQRAHNGDRLAPHVCVEHRRFGSIMVLPVIKLGSLFIKMVSKPVAKNLYTVGKDSPVMRPWFVRLGRGYSRFTMRLQGRCVSVSKHIDGDKSGGASRTGEKV